MLQENLIGIPGFDFVKVTGFDGVNDRNNLFNVPVWNHFQNVTGITKCSKTKVTIQTSKYILEYGNGANGAFFSLTITSTEDENNLQSMCVDEVWKRLDCAIEEIALMNNIKITYEKKNIRVVACEVALTFLTKESFTSYSTIFKAISHELTLRNVENNRDLGKKAEYKKDIPSVNLNCYDTETQSFTLKEYKSSHLIVYDKASKLIETQKIDSSKVNVIRVEYRFKEKNLIKVICEPGKKTNHLDGITDKSICDYFVSQFTKSFNRLENIFSWNNDCFLSNDKNIITYFMNANSIEVDEDTRVENIITMIRKFYTDENLYNKWKLLDMKDLTQLYSICKLDYIKVLKRMEERQEDELIRRFCNQRDLFLEIRDKICNPKKVILTLNTETKELNLKEENPWL